MDRDGSSKPEDQKKYKIRSSRENRKARAGARGRFKFEDGKLLGHRIIQRRRQLDGYRINERSKLKRGGFRLKFSANKYNRGGRYIR